METQAEKVVPGLSSWCRMAPARERRTVIVRPRHGVDLGEVGRDVEQIGARVVSSGAGAVVAVVVPAMVKLIAALAWGVAVEAPRRLLPRGASR